MSNEANKAVERRMVEEALNRGNMGVVEACLSADFVYHGPGGAEIKGTEGYKKFLTELRTWYPDINVTIETIIAEGDMVATRNFSTFSFKGKLIKLAGSIMDRFEDGKIAETWEHYDRLDLYRQIGIEPPPPAAAPRD
jgi:predicted SnoaL-like aldol condensation-catalyzing enzyme